MQVNIYGHGNIPSKHNPVTRVLRTEHVFEAAGQGTCMILVLDADDSVDVVIQYPDGQRSILESLPKQEAA
jgi:hypothetical protein